MDVVCSLRTMFARREPHEVPVYSGRSRIRVNSSAPLRISLLWARATRTSQLFFQALTNEETATVVIVKHPPNPMVFRGKRLTDSLPSLHPCVTTPLCHLSIEESVTPEVGRCDSRRCCLQRKGRISNVERKPMKQKPEPWLGRAMLSHTLPATSKANETHVLFLVSVCILLQMFRKAVVSCARNHRFATWSKKSMTSMY